MGNSGMLYACILLLFLQFCFAYFCENGTSITKIQMPDDDILMSLSDFTAHVVNHEFIQIFYVPKLPVHYEIWKNYVVTFEKNLEIGNYTKYATAEEKGTNIEITRNYKLISRTEKAFFEVVNENKVVPIWSSYPEEYYWTLRCSNYKGGKTCPIENVNMGLFLKQGWCQLHLADIMDDVCNATSVKFGAEEFEWIYTTDEC